MRYLNFIKIFIIVYNSTLFPINLNYERVNFLYEAK